MILKSETYNFHRLDLARQAGFIVTIYDEDGLSLAATMPFPTPCRSLRGSAKDRGQQGRGTEGLAAMTLGNMRANGVHTLAAWCLGRGCEHRRLFGSDSS